jgi:hypothetical protein
MEAVMDTLPQQNSLAEQRYFGEDTSRSEVYYVAEAVAKDLKAAIGDLLWMCGDEADRTSRAVWMRWKRLEQLFALIRHRGDEYSPLMMTGIEKQLASEMKDADQANIDYDESDVLPAYFEGYLREFAGAIIRALKKEMGEYEADLFDNEVTA